MIREELNQRLETLHAEFEKGQKQLRDIRQQQTYLQETLLRIQGAMQVLEEMLGEYTPKETAGVHAMESIVGRKVG